MNVVILSDQSFSKAIKAWIRTDPFYSKRVSYLRGSVVDGDDLERVRISVAAAVFVYTNSFNQDDKRNIIRASSIQCSLSPEIPLLVMLNKSTHCAFAVWTPRPPFS